MLNQYISFKLPSADRLKLIEKWECRHSHCLILATPQLKKGRYYGAIFYHIETMAMGALDIIRN